MSEVDLSLRSAEERALFQPMRKAVLPPTEERVPGLQFEAGVADGVGPEARGRDVANVVGEVGSMLPGSGKLSALAARRSNLGLR